jgi:hypothetical protein
MILPIGLGIGAVVAAVREQRRRTGRKLCCPIGADPGRVTVRRLNRMEYEFTIQDLFGTNLISEGEFSSDVSTSRSRLRDLLPPDEAEKRCKDIVRRLRWKGPVMRISGATRTGTQELCQAIMRRLDDMARDEADAAAAAEEE